ASLQVALLEHGRHLVAPVGDGQTEAAELALEDFQTLLHDSPDPCCAGRARAVNHDVGGSARRGGSERGGWRSTWWVRDTGRRCHRAGRQPSRAASAWGVSAWWSPWGRGRWG